MPEPAPYCSTLCEPFAVYALGSKGRGIDGVSRCRKPVLAPILGPRLGGVCHLDRPVRHLRQVDCPYHDGDQHGKDQRGLGQRLPRFPVPSPVPSAKSNSRQYVHVPSLGTPAPSTLRPRSLLPNPGIPVPEQPGTTSPANHGSVKVRPSAPQRRTVFPSGGWS